MLTNGLLFELKIKELQLLNTNYEKNESLKENTLQMYGEHISNDLKNMHKIKDRSKLEERIFFIINTLVQ